MIRKLVWGVAALGAVALMVAAACSGSNGNLSIRTSTVTADAGTDGGASAGGLDLGNGIVLTEVRFLLRRVLLDRCDGTASCQTCGECSGEKDEGSEGCDDCDRCEEEVSRVRAGPVLIDLKGADLAGGVHAVLDAKVPTGTYSEVKFVLSQASEAMVQAHPELAAMKALHASIALDGTIDGSSFEFVTPMHVQQERCGPFTVGQGTSVLTLVVSPSGWFVGDQGQRLDPRAHPDRGEILENLRRSLRVKVPGDGDDEGEGGECVCPAVDGGPTDGGTTDGGGGDGGAPL
jgi:hypothetical protein